MILTSPLFPIKSLGQNFLVNPTVTRRIIDACNLKSTDTVLEIGPGKGALTRALAEKAKKVIAIEKDHRLSAHLIKEYPGSNIQIVHGDILNYPLGTLPPNTKIIGNLPYNIVTPIIEVIIRER